MSASGMHLLISGLSSQELNLLLQPGYNIGLPAHSLLTGAHLSFKPPYMFLMFLHQVKAAYLLYEQRNAVQETSYLRISNMA